MPGYNFDHITRLLQRDPPPLKPMTTRPSKLNDHWWKTYRAIFKALHGREAESTEYSPRAGDATNAAFEALGLPRYVKS